MNIIHLVNKCCGNGVTLKEQNLSKRFRLLPCLFYEILFMLFNFLIAKIFTFKFFGWLITFFYFNTIFARICKKKLKSSHILNVKPFHLNFYNAFKTCPTSSIKKDYMQKKKIYCMSCHFPKSLLKHCKKIQLSGTHLC